MINIKQRILDVFAEELGDAGKEALAEIDGTGEITVEESENNGKLLMGVKLYQKILPLLDEPKGKECCKSNVRAKFRVNSKDTFGVQLEVVTCGSEENEQFWKYTPSGLIQMGIDNQDALEQFEVGKEYYVDFTLAE